MKTKNPKLKRIELEKVFIEFLDGNVVLLKFKEDVVFELRDAIETNKAVYSMVKGNPFLSLVDARIYGSISSDARDFFAKDLLTKDIRIAEAIVLDNLATRLFAKFYIKVSRLANPIKIFSDFDDAKLWLQLQQKKRYGSIEERDLTFHDKFIEN